MKIGLEFARMGGNAASALNRAVELAEATLGCNDLAFDVMPTLYVGSDSYTEDDLVLVVEQPGDEPVAGRIVKIECGTEDHDALLTLDTSSQFKSGQRQVVLNAGTSAIEKLTMEGTDEDRND